MEQKNLLQNADLDRDFAPYRNEESLQVPGGWAPWWLTARPEDPEWKNQKPGFSAFEIDGRIVQRVDSAFATHTAGLWQQVPAAPGNRYQLSVVTQAWSSEDEEPGSQKEASDVALQVGVDPTGGLDPGSPLIQWSDPRQALSHWETLRFSFEAQANVITVYTRSAPALPKRQQAVFWRDALLMPSGRYKRALTIVGPGDTHIALEPEQPEPENAVALAISSTRNHVFVDLHISRPDNKQATAVFKGAIEEDGRTIWQYTFVPERPGLYDIRFVSDRGARLLAQRLVRVSRQTQLVPSGEPREVYRRVYVLLPPTATEKWLMAAARGAYPGRYTVGFSADDAGLGDLEERYVIAVNPHHWPGVLTAAWFKQNYPGTIFEPIVANSPADLEAWLKKWAPEEEAQD